MRYDRAHLRTDSLQCYSFELADDLAAARSVQFHSLDLVEPCNTLVLLVVSAEVEMAVFGFVVSFHSAFAVVDEG